MSVSGRVTCEYTTSCTASVIVPYLAIRFFFVIPTTNLFPEAKQNITLAQTLHGDGVFTCMKKNKI